MAIIYLPNLTCVNYMDIRPNSSGTLIVSSPSAELRSYIQINGGEKKPNSSRYIHIPFPVTVPNDDKIIIKGKYEYKSTGATDATLRSNQRIIIPASTTGKDDVILCNLPMVGDALTDTHEIDNVDITEKIKAYKGKTITLEFYFDYTLKTSGKETHTYTFSSGLKNTCRRWNGSGWEICEVYRYNGSNWESCELYRINKDGKKELCE